MKVKNCDICGVDCDGVEASILLVSGKDIDLCLGCAEPLNKIIDSPNKNYKIKVVEND